MSERRYDDDEIREILTRATEVRHDTPALPAGSGDVGGDGLPLAEPKDAEGSLQTWSNGHLKALSEPLPEGARVRLRSRHDAVLLWSISLGVLPVGAALRAAGRPGAPRWLPTRRSQSEAPGGEARRAVAAGSSPAAPETL